MVQIQPNLFIGNEQDARNHHTLKSCGITYVIGITSQGIPCPPGITYLIFKPDSHRLWKEEWTDSIISAVTEVLSSGQRLLIHDDWGMVRCCTAVLFYLTHTGKSYKDALNILRSRYPNANPYYPRETPSIVSSIINISPPPPLQSPRVSVILNSYNRTDWLREAIESVYKQTFKDWELIIVDDGSREETLKILEEYKGKEKTRVLLKEHCGNLAVRRNDGLEAARGEFITFLDDDNRYNSHRLERLVEFADEHPEAGLYFNTSRRLSEKGGLGGIVTFGRTRPDDLSTIESMNCLDSNEVMIRKETIDEVGFFWEKAIVLEDWDLFLRILDRKKALCLPEPLSFYRLHSTNRVKYTSDKKMIPMVLGHRFLCQRPLRILFVQDHSKDKMESQREAALFTVETLKKMAHLDIIEASAGEAPFKEDYDLTIFFSPFSMSPDIVNPKTFSIAIMIEDPYAIENNLRFAKKCDWVFTNDRGCVEDYRAAGIKNVGVMPSLSVYPPVHEPPKTRPLNRLTLVGTGFTERIDAIKKLSLSLSIPIYCYGPYWEEIKGVKCVAKRIEQKEMIKVYARSKYILCLNRQDKRSPITPTRGFVEAYMGNCVLMDSMRPELPKYFRVGEEMLVFNNISEISHLIKKHARDIRKIGKLGRERAKEYTYKNRLTRMLNLIRAERVSDVP